MDRSWQSETVFWAFGKLMGSSYSETKWQRCWVHKRQIFKPASQKPAYDSKAAPAGYLDGAEHRRG